MLKRKLVIIVAIGLAACGEPTTTDQLTIKSTVPLSPTVNINTIEGSKSKPLDLDLSVENYTVSRKSDDFSKREMLPDLFNQSEDEKKTVFSGKLLNDPTNPDYVDSIEGAKISVEVKIK
jgi:hypothetical protein